LCENTTVSEKNLHQKDAELHLVTGLKNENGRYSTVLTATNTPCLGAVAAMLVLFPSGMMFFY